MRLPEIINADQMRSINRTAILEVIRQNSPIARSNIGRMLGLSLPTVMRIVDELFQENMVCYSETRLNHIRRRELIEYHKDGHTVIGLNLDGVNLYGALANIGGDIISEMLVEQHGTTGEKSLELIVNSIEQLLAAPRKDNQSILGIAIGIPGVTHAKSGIVEWAPSLLWRDLPLKHILEKRFKFPVSVDNDLNLAALGENWFGVGQGTHEMVLIATGTGAGAGVIIDGAIYRGASEAAGEIGYMIADLSVLKKSYPNYGPLEDLISSEPIAQKGRLALNGQRSPAELQKLTAEDVFSAARQQQSWAMKIVEETAGYLSMTIANITALINPELVALGSGLASGADLFIPLVQAQLKNILPNLPRIEASTLGHRATVMGAIAITVHHSSDYYVVKKLY
jgi:glucokinase